MNWRSSLFGTKSKSSSPSNSSNNKENVEILKQNADDHQEMELKKGVPLSSTISGASSQSKPPSKNILYQVFRYYKKQYTPSQERVNLWRSGAVKYVAKPVGFLTLGFVVVMLSDSVYRQFKVDEDAPSIFGRKGKIIKPHTLIYESDWLTDSVNIKQDEKDGSSSSFLKNYFGKKKNNTVVDDGTSAENKAMVEGSNHDIKKFYAKLDIMNQQQESVDSSSTAEDDDTIIRHIHVEKFHPYVNSNEGYYSTLLEYAIMRERMHGGQVALKLIKEEQEAFSSFLWRKLVTKKDYSPWKETNYWIEKPWNLSEINLDLNQKSEVEVKNFKEYLEQGVSDVEVKEIILKTLNHENTAISELVKDNNHYLYVSDEAFSEFKKSNKSKIRVVEKSANRGDMLFIVGSSIKVPSVDGVAQVPPVDVSSINFVTHKTEPIYIEEFKKKELENHSPLWLRALIVAGSLGLAVATIIN